jgi:hypothetical protein
LGKAITTTNEAFLDFNPSVLVMNATEFMANISDSFKLPSSSIHTTLTNELFCAGKNRKTDGKGCGK